MGLLICLLGWGQQMHANCLVIDQLDKLHAIQSRLARNPDTGLFSTDIRQLRAIRRELSNRGTLDAVDGNSFTGPGADFMRFLQNTQSLLQSASLDDPNSVRQHFNQSARDNLRRIRGHLTGLRCNDDQIAVDSAAAAQGTSGGNSDAEDLAEVAETLAALAEEVFQIRTLFIALLIAGITIVSVPIIRRWMILRLRRAKRHNITYQTRYRWDDRQVQGMLIDVNCYGAKLRHEPDNPIPQGTTISIEICDVWTEGTVMWGNMHYSGVQFRHTIRLTDVDTMRLQGDPNKAPAEMQNGAPKDAA